jgi:site-specific recombinase XerD
MSETGVSPGVVPGAAAVHLAGGLALLHPDEQVFTAMLDGWRNQQLARNLAVSTIDGRASAIRAFARHADALPWQWTAQHADEWFGDLRAVRGCARSTLRSYQNAVQLFCGYATDPAYDWAGECVQRFGTHPVQVIHEWNTAVHVADSEAGPRKRAYTRTELQELFDYADDQVARKRAAGRKGWLPAFRDAVLFKTAYGFGLRRTEAQMLDAADFGRNPAGPEFGEFGVCYVRYGKAQKGSPPKRRSVLTVWQWTAEILEQWFTEVRPLFAVDGDPSAWPSERSARICGRHVNSQLAAYRDALGMDRHLDFHSFRRSYVTHLIEDGYDPRFVQEQAGHAHASTTSIYTCVSSDFRVRTLRRALDDTVAAALATERSTR